MGIFVGNNLKHIIIVNLSVHFALMPRSYTVNFQVLFDHFFYV